MTQQISFIQGVHHIAIISTNYTVSKSFYVDILGCSIINETYRKERDSFKLDLQVPHSTTQIELFSFPNPPSRPSRPEAAGLRHLAFAVKDIVEAVHMLNEKGVVCEDIRIDGLTGARFTFFADPDGLPLELYEVR